MVHYHNRGTMEITGGNVPLQGKGRPYSVGNQFGAFKVTAIGKVDGGDSSEATYINAIDFAASRTWKNITSVPRNSSNDANINNTDSAGTTAKPPTVAFMWILRFI